MTLTTIRAFLQTPIRWYYALVKVFRWTFYPPRRGLGYRTVPLTGRTWCWYCDSWTRENEQGDCVVCIKEGR